MNDSVKSGFVTIAGKPNVGKSTFLNHVLGEKISITTSKPQTTRDRILGIWNVPDAQIVFLDTPGLHVSDKALNRYMIEKAIATMNDADIVMVMAEPKETAESLCLITPYLEQSSNDKILVLNKIDMMPQDLVDEKIAELATAYDFRHACGISSVNGEGVEALMNVLKKVLPEGPRYFPEDLLTDLSVRFLSKELIREKVFALTRKEIPYAVAVEIEEFREGDPTYIRAVIHVEKSSQKGIVIGAGGAMLRTIGKEARLDIQRLIGTKVFLELFVKVTKDWTKRPKILRELGYK
ncbi:MAG TPA: GTPase Era [Deltaproteobacteria bacterium]|nr:GTPase Era [Deltaproteobacteria bacterium]HPJ94941.1 GTPase Era [Deltaproteobacteria bacterium]